MKFIIDSREQQPYTEYFEKLSYKYEVKALPIGDYSIEGHPEFAIERKTLDDFITSITRERDRFERELVKTKELAYFAVVIECSIYDIQNRHYHSKIHPHTILANLFSLMVKYKIPFLFVESRTGGALAVIEMSKAYLKYYGENNGKQQ